MNNFEHWRVIDVQIWTFIEGWADAGAVVIQKRPGALPRKIRLEMVEENFVKVME